MDHRCQRPPTRASRVAETARLAAQGIRAISGANQAAPSLNFPICLQGNGDGATQYQRTVSMAAQRQTGFADARECTPQDAIAEYRSPRASCDGLEVMTQHNLSTTVAPGGAPVRLRCMRQGDHFRY